MLDKDIISQLKGIFSNLTTPITLVVNGAVDIEATREMTRFADDFASASDLLSVKSTGIPTPENAPLLSILKEGKPTGVSFCGIPIPESDTIKTR